MTAILRKLEIIFEDDGSVRSGRGSYVKLDAEGADVELGVKREDDAVALIPAEVRGAAEFAAITAERDAALAGIDAAVADKDAEIAALTARVEALTPPAQGPAIHVAWFRAALADMGKLAAVDELVATQDAIKRTLWEYATAIDITRPDVVAIATALEIDLEAVMERARAIRGVESAGA